jgi:hypothetical protein
MNSKALSEHVRAGLIVTCLAVAACAVRPPPDTASVPPGAFGLFDNDVAAANQASSAFAVPARTLNNPIDAARTAAAVDYPAGQLSSSRRWVTVSPLTKMQMLQARADVRRVLGIKPDASSQYVTNGLLAFAWNMQYGNMLAATQVLATPIFTLPPEQTLQVLNAMPYIQSANIASIDVVDRMLPGGEIATR